MNQNLQYSIDFLGAIWYNGSLQLNTYSINMQMVTASERPVIINVAMERIKAFVMSELADVLFINSAHQSEAEMFDALGVNVCTLPDEPHDQVVGMMLFCKLNAVTESQLIITQLDISSSLGDDVWYQHSMEDPLGYYGQPGWWHSRGCQKNNLCISTDDNVVKVETSSWQEYDLEWPDVPGAQPSTVVKPDFKKHETNSTR